ncbi:LytTR family DNA-binding domain-containing protein [Bacteroides sp. 519]|uniref:LytR/AlgR family response regulator transcription factor n=1 Tax=Bacteroides sp. 519 TaxID=2302937 RepID=UPI0013D7F77F|nr:LytTR family DNA-binding domain-containing protein [Bacteroides sp. 519]NDV58010.1 LytTR family transcriptional regulator [Bacteroides sp. 519]
MYKHPFIENQYRKTAVGIIVVLAISLYALLLWFYGSIPLYAALLDSSISILVLFLLGFLFWFIVDTIHIPQAEFILSLVVILAWLIVCFVIQLIEYPMDKLFFQRFLFLLPLRFTFAILVWFILVQWYRTVKLNRWKKDRLLSESVQTQLAETMDRIAVKNGSRIHVIQVNNLTHVQACGDYVMLFTAEGEFLKEQTMKSLEQNLPENFVRIHRSYIVNVEYIDRVELYAKETYHIHLKNGTTLRASISGYKQLKETLSI